MRPFKSTFLSLRGRRHHLRQWGGSSRSDTPTLVCLHGWGDIGASFQFVVDALPDEWRIIAPDWRGFGLSERNASTYWFPDYLADLDALLEALSPQEPLTLIGHSMGGIVASLYAGIRPARVNNLIMLEGLVLWSAPPERTPERCAHWLDALREENAHFRTYATRSDFANRLQRDNPRLTAERAAFIATHALEHGADGQLTFAADPRHRWPTPTLFPLDGAMACWRQVRAPTLSLIGADSSIMRRLATPAADYPARIACFSNARETIVADCGHNLHHDQPECVAQHIVQMLST